MTSTRPADDQPVAAGRAIIFDLTGRWSVEALEPAPQAPDAVRGKSVPACVPGCVHTDLLDNDLIADPLVGLNELDAHWIGRTSWRYTREFVWKETMELLERLELVCEGLDTIALVRLNGVDLGTAENMHVQHRFDIRDALKTGGNTLVIDFEAPIDAARARAEHFGDHPCSGNGSNELFPHNMVRKMACSFGWDWGPSLPTSGIWKPIRIEAWSGARIRSVRPLVGFADESRADVDVFVDLDWADEAHAPQARVSVVDPSGQTIATALAVAGEDRTAIATISVDHPQLWWPVGYGGQPLYHIDVAVDDGKPGVRNWSGKIGLRRVELIDEQQEGNRRRFAIAVNGRELFCKGANWIPDDPFPSRITPQQYRERVTQARDANMNMLRVWGGGLYEAEAFYDACDELGILVWQDFLCACATYSEDEPYPALFESEARQAVARLARHPSLALWCGNNECHVGIQGWYTEHRDSGRPWGALYYHEVFPRVIRELDPSRPYWPGSPYSGEPDRRAHDDDAGDEHLWDVWNGTRNGDAYLERIPRFASEFGFHGPATWATVTRAIPADQLERESAAMVLHNKHKRGQPLATELMSEHFDPPEEFEAWHYLAQVMQARAVSLGCRWFRAHWPYCTGALYWQLNDCWPVASWAAIDGDGRPKPLWYETRRFFAPRMLVLLPADRVERGGTLGPLAAWLHNDAEEAWEGSLALRLIDVRDGSTIAHLDEQYAVIEPRSAERFVVPQEFAAAGSASNVLIAEFAGERANHFFAPDREIPYAEPRIDASLQQLGGDLYHLNLTARAVIRELCILTDRISVGATQSDQLFTLLPGDEVGISIECDEPLTVEQLLAPPVFRCANQFGRSQQAG